METAVKEFFSSPRFAVAGASQDTNKFGYKSELSSPLVAKKPNPLTTHLFLVFAWYHRHSLPVTPINPKSPEITFPSKSYPTVASPSALHSPSQTSLSIITPPKASLKILQEAKEVNVPAVWLQPGSFDKEVLEYAQNNFKAAIGGDGGAGSEGWCVLVDGEDGLDAAGVNWTSQKL
jgi:predicted CoA-binding protein